MADATVAKLIMLGKRDEDHDDICQKASGYEIVLAWVFDIDLENLGPD